MTADTLCPVCGQDNAPDGPGCRCYGDPLPPYWPGVRPNAAELAAFRADLAVRGRVYIVAPPADTPRRYDHRARPVCTAMLARPVSGAWADERAHGIGHSCAVIGDPCDLRAARREAAAMRSRAYVLRWGTWEYKRGVERDHPDVRVDDWTHWVSTPESTADHQAFQPRYIGALSR